jgi:hypothetical protein
MELSKILGSFKRMLFKAKEISKNKLIMNITVASITFQVKEHMLACTHSLKVPKR